MEQKVVFFDGVCGLCNRFIDWIIRRKNAHRLRFSTLQGTSAMELLPSELTEELKSVIYLRNGKMHTASGAALYILKDLGFPWNLAFVFIIVPPFLWDAVYYWVGKNRYKWFGKKESCRLPSPQERELFLP